MFAILKWFYALILLILFFVLFGYQSIDQFMAKKYNMVTEIVNSDGTDVPAPQLTVLRINSNDKNVSYFQDKVEIQMQCFFFKFLIL